MGFDISTEKFLGRRALRGDDYTLILEAPLSSVFQVRLAALRHTIVFLLLILAAVFLVVHALLRRIVVEPISVEGTDETGTTATENEPETGDEDKDTPHDEQ